MNHKEVKELLNEAERCFRIEYIQEKIMLLYLRS